MHNNTCFGANNFRGHSTRKPASVDCDEQGDLFYSAGWHRNLPQRAWLYSDLLQTLKGEPLSSGFSTDMSLISAFALPHCSFGTDPCPSEFLLDHKFVVNATVFSFSPTSWATLYCTGWTMWKSGRPCPCQHCSRCPPQKRLEEDLRWIVLRVFLPPKKKRKEKKKDPVGQ